ncbi:hypothetical protein A7M48_22315 [Acinetobacter baumannii]|nr:hypothetical protein A7M48_22315 [Acinetobacter baumannii]
MVFHVHQANALQDRMMQLPVQIVGPLRLHERQCLVAGAALQVFPHSVGAKCIQSQMGSMQSGGSTHRCVRDS